MRLLIVRHAIAENRAAFFGEDDDRPLTTEGMRRMKKAAKGLSRFLAEKPSQMMVSPLIRALQTAEILQKSWPGIQVMTTEVLRPDGDVRECAKWLASICAGADDFLAIVGHEPQLSTLVSWLVSGSKKSQFEIKKGGACLLEFAQEPKASHGRLLWLAPPALLRSLA